MKRVVLLRGATDELRAAAQWYERRATGLGQDFVTEVSGKLKRVAESPEAYSLWPANGKFRRALVQRFPYVVFFRDEEDAIYVYAIAHAKQRPGYWARRRR